MKNGDPVNSQTTEACWIELFGYRTSECNVGQEYLHRVIQEASIRKTVTGVFNLLIGFLSDAKHISCGVPQRSILGSFSFVIYIYDLPFPVNSSKAAMFADDTYLTIMVPCLV